MRFFRPKSRLGLVVRVFFAAVLVIGCSAGAVATAGLLQFQQVVQDISVDPGSIVKTKQVTLPAPGKPQTLLVIGSDHRANSPSFHNANTDTILLVRLNAASSTINVMSIPRDLQVVVPGYGTEKINEAYSQGGYGLLIKTIKQNVFPQLQVNHIIDTNFDGFSDIVNAIGCVWTDVDHRYYNQSQPFPSADNYASIDIQPGYQKLCGDSQVTGALAFVRFRHTDSDLVREARQQDFLRWAKENFPLSKLLADKDKLLRIFARHTTLDAELKTQNGIIELFDLILNANGDSLKQIPFPASLAAAVGSAPDYVYKESDQAVASAWAQFMHPTAKASSSSSQSRTRPHPSSSSGSARTTPPRPRITRGRRSTRAGLTADPADGIAQAKLLTPNMPVYYPRLILSGSQYCTATGYECLNGDEPITAYEHSYPRSYKVITTTGKRVHAYFMTIAINPLLGQYYGVQGVHWKNPPILNNPAGDQGVPRPHVRDLRGRSRPCHRRRVAGRRQLLLDLQHADEQHRHQADDRDRGVDRPLRRLTARPPARVGRARYRGGRCGSWCPRAAPHGVAGARGRGARHRGVRGSGCDGRPPAGQDARGRPLGAYGRVGQAADAAQARRAGDDPADRIRPPRRRVRSTTRNTDTILLVHLNAASSTINVMSIPRDLKVNVPSHYVPRCQLRDLIGAGGLRGEDQRHVQPGRLRAADPDDRAERLPGPEDHPHRRHELPGVLGPRRRDRLRLRRCRPPLLQHLERDHRRSERLLLDRHPARLPAAVRP